MQGLSSLQALRDALEKAPDNLSLLLLHGHACLEQLHLEEAQDSFEKVLELDLDHADAHLGLAKVYLTQGDTSAAAVRAERVIQRLPQQAQAHLLLSRIYLAEGDRSVAKEYLEKAAQLDSTLSDPALEQELGFSMREVRRQPLQPSLETPSLEGFEESETTASDFADDPLDEPPFDWRPETFFTPADTSRYGTAFADVGGLDELKEAVRLKMIYPLQHADLYKAYGKRTGGGLLIYGPPGCGKTHFMRAVAGEVSCNYLSVGLHEVFDPYFGSTERNLHLVFETARANAPCVLVFDDLDALAQDRRQVRDSQMRNLVNQFLHELDELRDENHRILVIGATNQPWALDPAFRRPGRFEQAVFVPPPDGASREQIITLLARDKPISDLNVKALAEATENFSGADLKYLIERVAEMTLSEAIHSGHPVPMRMETLLKVAREYEPSTLNWAAELEAGETALTPGKVAPDFRKPNQPTPTPKEG